MTSDTQTMQWSPIEIESFLSLPDSTQSEVIASLTPAEYGSLKTAILSTIEQPEAITEREAQRRIMDERRKRERDIRMPLPANVERRLACMADFELFATTYFPDVFYEDFTEDRRDMALSIINAAKFGGDQAIAGARGEGKTKLAIYTALFLMLSGLSRFPIVIGKSQSKAQGELSTVREKLQQSELLIADFPEIGVPFKAVGGWASRGRSQTVGGELTNVKMACDHLIFPTIPRSRLPRNWPAECEPCSCGQILGSVGVDGPIRGTNYRDERPSIAIIDDIEDREAANSDVLIERNEEIIEQDIAGLGPSGQRISRIMLCTTQNRKCIAYKYTDPKQKQSWKGRRYRKMLKPPARMDMVETYITMRKERSADDPDARVAFAYWRDNRNEIESDCLVSNKSSFDMRFHSDGEPLELSAVQSYYNRVADFGAKSVATEIDNDPPEETGPMGNGLTAVKVMSRVSTLLQRDITSTTELRTVAIDLGNYNSHWVDIAWEGNAIGSIVDYGIMETYGLNSQSDNHAIELAILASLEVWADDIVSRIKPLICFIDSGSGKGHTAAVYEFCRRRGRPFFPSKGWATTKFRMPQRVDGEKEPFLESWAHYLREDRVWLYNVHTEWWKPWVHERFITAPFDAGGFREPGSLTLFNPNGDKRRHNSFAHHIVSEEDQLLEARNGKPAQRVWFQKNDNNHWLDATALACAGAGAVGVRLVEQTPLIVQKYEPKPAFTNQFGQPFLATQR